MEGNRTFNRGRLKLLEGVEIERFKGEEKNVWNGRDRTFHGEELNVKRGRNRMLKRKIYDVKKEAKER